MRLRWLKLLRLGLGVLMLAALTLLFVDFRAWVPEAWAYGLASTQFGPSLLTLIAGGLSFVWLAILVGTALLGRVYCSTLCPLGLLQDTIGRLRSWIRPRRRPLPFARESRAVRYSVLGLVILTIALAGTGLAWAHTDPYSIFGRIFSGLVRPVAVAVNNLLVPAGQAVGLTSLYRVPPPWPGLGILLHPAAAAFTLLLLVALVAWRGRLYCNTLCPVGTVLGLLSRWSGFRLTIDQAACGKCAECLRTCKAQCIDLRTATIDGSRCVGCFNCAASCDRGAVHYRWTWRRIPAAPSAAPDRADVSRARDPGRRAFVSELGTTLITAAGAAALVSVARAEDDEGFDERRHRERRRRRAGHPDAISPPGAHSLDQLLDRCSACQLCVSACPTHVLQPAFLEYGLEGMMKPRLDFTAAFCNYDCHRCSDVCPTGALTPLTLEQKHVTRIGVAHLDLDHCVVKQNGTDCAACSEHCPTKALNTQPYGNNLRLPVLQSESCIGCGACEFACPATPKAVRVNGKRRHGEARPLFDEPPPAPPATGSSDFPF